MFRKLFLFGSIAAISLSIRGQQPSPTLVPDDQVVRINTDLIQIDVTVTDKAGKVVAGLKPDDFELYENGQLQKIASFSFVSRIAGGAAVNGGDSVSAPSAGNVGTSRPTRNAVRRTACRSHRRRCS